MNLLLILPLLMCCYFLYLYFDGVKKSKETKTEPKTKKEKWKMPTFIRSLGYQTQGLITLAVAAGIFFLAPYGIQMIDPTAGSYDAGVITRVAAGASFFFFGTFCVWLAMWLDWPDILKWADRKETPVGGKKPNSLGWAWQKFPDNQKIWYLLALFAVLMSFFFGCVFLIPA